MKPIRLKVLRMELKYILNQDGFMTKTWKLLTKSLCQNLALRQKVRLKSGE